MNTPHTQLGPCIVNPTSIFGAVITGGEFNGLPYGLAKVIASGDISMKEVKRRGWRFATNEELKEMQVKPRKA